MAPAYPYPGCIVEYLEDNAVHIAIVTEDNGGKLRLLLPGRREARIASSRLLPWYGPLHNSSASKEEMIHWLEGHKKKREAKEVQLMEIWELAQGEVARAPASWFAELMEASPDEDAVAAYGRALLGCKTHFKFDPPEFQIYNQETAEKRVREQEARKEKELIAAKGNSFIRLLWDVANNRRKLPPENDPAWPPQDLANRMCDVLFDRMANPESHKDDDLWQSISRGLPDEPHIPVRLLMAWNKLPQHYNFWLDRADYQAGDNWWEDCRARVDELAKLGEECGMEFASSLPFLSIDGASTMDIDDAFSVAKTETGWQVDLAFANPAYAWNFGGALDKLVAHRGTSVYLPESDLHMLPEKLGIDAYSLLADKKRIALCLSIILDENGKYQSCQPAIKTVEVAANLRYGDVQAIMEGDCSDSNPCSPYREQLLVANELGKLREQLRVAQGAIVMLRDEPAIIISQNDGQTQVEIVEEKPARDAQRLVSELMILASSAIAEWAKDNSLPLLHRSQNVTVPKEYAGVWGNPVELAKIMRSLIPSSLEVEDRPHAALGIPRYAQITSPLRRYTDFINVAQINHFLESGKARWLKGDLENFIAQLSPVLENAGHIQRYRPRYWKLLALKQQGENTWHNGVIIDENENFVTVCMATENLTVRGRRNLFDERACPGMEVKIRLGKINPLLNEIYILETMPIE